MKWLLALTLGFLVFVLPWRKTGEWQQWGSGQPSAALQAELNQLYFGRLPSYDWLWHKSAEALPENVLVPLANQGQFHLFRYRERVDWWLYAMQLLAATVIVFLFVRRRSGIEANARR